MKYTSRCPIGQFHAAGNDAMERDADPPFCYSPSPETGFDELSIAAILSKTFLMI